MSIGVSGIIYLNKYDIKTREEISFKITEIACKYKVGCKFGGNISQRIYINYSDEIKDYTLFFELMDTPLDNVAEELFGCEMHDGGSEYETLSSRLTRVESLLLEIINILSVNEIILDINYYEGIKEIEMETCCSEFCKKILALYTKGSIDVPVVRVIMRKDIQMKNPILK